MLASSLGGSGSPCFLMAAMPPSCLSHANGAPARPRIFTTAAVISGPMPSPGISVAGIFFRTVIWRFPLKRESIRIPVFATLASPMSQLSFKQVDVFTDRPFLGNPVAVVIGADGMSSETMRRIANWTNLSETTFLLRSEAADYRLRIFTPRQELPFAGHPTIGSAHAALESGFVSSKKNLTQECGAGILDLCVEDGRIFVKGPPPKIAPVERVPGFELQSTPLRVDVGPVWIVGEVADARTLAGLQPDMAALASFTNSLAASGLTLFAKSDDCVAAIHVRSFAPAHGIPEDPVCGSGNLSVAAYLNFKDELNRFGTHYVARQGAQVGRDGRIFVRVDADGLRIGGHAVTCVDGKITL
jgi:PhzF family phenazine biosynthesis protein